MSDTYIHHVDAVTTLLLAESSVQAYNTFPNGATGPIDLIVPPQGWEIVGVFSGTDPSQIFAPSNEPFGVIFRRQTANLQERECIVAFRGTWSYFDAWEDVCVETVPFTPFRNGDGVQQVQVCDGFHGIYVTPDTTRNIPSMQQQLFTWIDALRPTSLLITGHSLGAALSELFTLDLSISGVASAPFPRVYNYNFAGPRVGLADFATLYDGRANLNQTIRVVNYWDWVPYVPYEWMGFQHVGACFLISFYQKGEWVPHLPVRHSLLNYQAVLTLALPLPNQVYVGDVPGADGVTLWSEAPPATLAADVAQLTVALQPAQQQPPEFARGTN
jgi:hypothetical protein